MRSTQSQVDRSHAPALASTCGATLPDDVAGYESRCVRLNAKPIPPYEGDPHKGMKNVYACNVGLE